MICKYVRHTADAIDVFFLSFKYVFVSAWLFVQVKARELTNKQKRVVDFPLHKRTLLNQNLKWKSEINGDHKH